MTWSGTPVPISSTVPQSIKQAILLLAAHWYEHREGVADGVSPKEVPLAVESLLWINRFMGGVNS